MQQVGSVVIVMARVLGLLWMRNPLAIVHHAEQQGVVPAHAVEYGRQQPPRFKKGDALCAAQPGGTSQVLQCSTADVKAGLQSPTATP